MRTVEPLLNIRHPICRWVADRYQLYRYSNYFDILVHVLNAKG
jgi:hypothetical protein